MSSVVDPWQSHCEGLQQLDDGRIKFACPLNPDHLVVGRPLGRIYHLLCLGDCPTEQVLDALGITQSDLIIPASPSAQEIPSGPCAPQDVVSPNGALLHAQDFPKWRYDLGMEMKTYLDAVPEKSRHLIASMEPAELAKELVAGARKHLAEFPVPPEFELSETDVDDELNKLASLAVERFREAYLPALGEEQRAASKPIQFRTVAAVLEEYGALDLRKQFLAGILREGEVSMLAGRALAGKSTAACALTRALTLGIPFVRRATIKCRGGYMALERNGVTVARLFARWKLPEVYFCDSLAGTDIEVLAAALEEQIREHQLEVVFVDHLQNFARVKDSDRYALVTSAMEPLNQVAKRTRSHIMVLHHQGKTEREGVIDVMGSEAYRAAADALLEARVRDGHHFIRGEIRGAEDLAKMRITVDLATGEVDAINASEATREDTATKIAEYLAGLSKPVTGNEIQEALSLRRELCWAALQRGVERGLFKRSGEGKRGNPFRYFSSRSYKYTAGTESENGKKPQRNKGPIQFPKAGN